MPRKNNKNNKAKKAKGKKQNQKKGETKDVQTEGNIEILSEVKVTIASNDNRYGFLFTNLQC